MKHIFFMLILEAIVISTFGQQIIIRESDSAKHFSFIKLKKSEITRMIQSYDILNKSEYKFMTHWGTNGGDTIYWTNGENIYMSEFGKNTGSSMICDNLYFILEFYVTSDYIYVAYQPSQLNGPNDNRYKKGLKLCRVRIGTWKKEVLDFPSAYNVTNFVVSPNGEWASFINTVIGKEAKYQMVLYNISKEKIKIIDSADSGKNEWFGDDDKFNSTLWVNEDVLMYYKHTNRTTFGEIINYDLKLKNKKVSLRYMPKRDFSWFGFYDGYFYFSKRNDLFRIKDEIKEQSVFVDINKLKNILAAIVLPD